MPQAPSSHIIGDYARRPAALLKTRIRDTSRFVLLASKNSKESKWVPWELGIADGVKGTSKIALFPASESSYDKAWASWEYLGSGPIDPRGMI